VRVIARHQPDSQAGWLGVQLAPVPAAVASQLRLDQNGVMIRNIFEDSPADEAKLERYDVIVAVDEQQVEGGMEKFTRLVQSRKPGDQLKLTLYRGGQKTEATVTLASTPRRLDEGALKYEDDPDVAERRMFGLRGKILRPGPQGWILDDLGELPDLPEFEGWFERDPKGDDIEESRVDAKGETIHVRKNRDGSIEVRRHRRGTPLEQIEPKVYDNLDQLREEDPEAAELLESTTRPAGRDDEPGDGWRRDLKKHEDDVRGYQESMRQYQDALRDYMKRFRHRGDPGMPEPPDAPKWREWRERLMPGPGSPSDRLMPAPGSPFTPPAPLRPAEPLPEARFELHPDGSITANVDDGPTQLNLTFPDEKAFEEQAPKLYERYRRSLERTR
jgi:hypothetical protein